MCGLPQCWFFPVQGREDFSKQMTPLNRASYHVVLLPLILTLPPSSCLTPFKSRGALKPRCSVRLCLHFLFAHLSYSVLYTPVCTPSLRISSWRWGGWSVLCLPIVLGIGSWTLGSQLTLVALTWTSADQFSEPLYLAYTFVNYAFHLHSLLVIFWLCHIMQNLSSPTRDQIHAPVVEVQSLNHWTAREFPLLVILEAHTQNPFKVYGKNFRSYVTWVH